MFLNASFLYPCLTGLRISDILNLKWENLCTAPDLGHCIRLRTQKTQTEALLPISYEAYALCGEPVRHEKRDAFLNTGISHGVEARVFNSSCVKNSL